MMIKLKKIDQLKTKTRRKVAVLLVAYHSVTVIQNETLELSYYVIPKDSKLRKRLLAVISRKDFTSAASHRVCSLHFAGGKKIYLNNVATTVTKTENDRTYSKKSIVQYKSFKEVVAKCKDSRRPNKIY